METRPRLLLTLGDVAGIGPEVVVRAWQHPELHQLCRPVILGDAAQVRKTLELLRLPGAVQAAGLIAEADPTPARLVCIQATEQDLSQVRWGQVSAAAGRAAYDFLCQAIDRTLAGEADGIVTAPLHKEGLRAAGLSYPGHTEILAERTLTPRFAMMLFAEGNRQKAAGSRAAKPSSPQPLSPEGRGAFRTDTQCLDGLGVTHVTLHLRLRDVFAHLRPEAVLEKIELTDTMLTRLLGRRPRIGVCALNPHASDGGLFGDEERTIIAPAVDAAEQRGIRASGPWPSDTLFVRAHRGEFDGVVAMYHDQGHIALKLLAGHRAVNISLGLPLVRTSVAHGTAYDIAGRGVADATSMLAAVRVAARLVERQP
jgi:4-hydroxythreonine-4-phosphate dehydrogenase